MSGGDNLDFEIRPNPAPVSDADRASLLTNPGFGRVFTDHMVTVRYAEGKGWYEPRVEARAPIPMDPAAAVLHYAQEIFEGLKAYTLPDGGIAMFRPDANANRFAQSARRMAMPALPVETFIRYQAALGQAPARRMVHGSDRPATRARPSSRKRLTPTPAVPPRMRVRDRPPAASSSTAASRAKATSRPTNRALV